MPSLLLVDDEAAIRESLGEYLSSQGFELKIASSVSEALDTAAKDKPDLIVSDLMLGEGDGLELKAELTKRYGEQEPGFVLMTGHASMETALDALNLGVDQYLLKPVNLKDLSRAIDNGLKRKKHQAQQALKVRFELAEQFYHDLSLPMNQLIPRLCMLLEGRHGALSMAQNRNISSQFESLRRLLWLMKGFYPRLLEGSCELARRQATALNKMTRSLSIKLEDEAEQRRVELKLGNPGETRPAFLIPETAESFLEILTLRALAIAEPGSVLEGQWESYPDRAELTLRLQFPGNGPGSPIAALMPMVPFSQGCLESAGLDFEAAGPAGPWTVRFSLLS